MKDLVIVANTSQPLGKYSCSKCGNTVTATTGVIANCPYCGDEFEEEPTKVSATVTATLSENDSFAVDCDDCSAHLAVYNSDNNAIEFSAARYCPVCGGQNLEESEDDSTDKFTDSACKDGSCDELATVSEDEDEEDQKPKKKSSIKDTQKDVRNTLDDGGAVTNITSEALQWKAVDDEKNGKKGTLIAFSATTGNPLFVFRKSNCSQDLQDIFGTSIMVEAFNQIARTDGIGTAVNKFGGQTYNTKEVLKSNYIDSLVNAKINKEVIPKFIECMALTVDGAIKGIYADVRQDINDAMANELVGAGLPRERVEAAITATLGTGGTSVFASILAKAAKLMKEPPAVFESSKSMIASAQVTNDIDLEQQHVRQKLNASTSGIMLDNAVESITSNWGSGFDDDVKKLREQLKFSVKLN